MSTIDPVDACPACGGRSRTPVLGDGHGALDLARCDDCRLVHAIGRTRTEVLDAGYGVRAQGHDEVDRERKQRAVALFDELSGGRIMRPEPGATALDLGCNTGLLLDVLAEVGYATEGVERSPGARAFAERSHRIHDLDLESPGATTGRRYALVTMTHVLEHLGDPIAALRFVARHLDEDGIGVIEVPNWDDIARGLWGASYRPLELGDHICFFDRDTLGDAVAKGGLAVQRMWSRPQGATLVMPSLLTALDRARALMPWSRTSTSGAMSAREDLGQRASGSVRARVLGALDRLDPWLARVAGPASRAGANLVAIVGRQRGASA
jgi:SAM-dependent methyltransferase